MFPHFSFVGLTPELSSVILLVSTSMCSEDVTLFTCTKVKGLSISYQRLVLELE